MASFECVLEWNSISMKLETVHNQALAWRAFSSARGHYLAAVSSNRSIAGRETNPGSVPSLRGSTIWQRVCCVCQTPSEIMLATTCATTVSIYPAICVLGSKCVCVCVLPASDSSSVIKCRECWWENSSSWLCHFYRRRQREGEMKRQIYSTHTHTHQASPDISFCFPLWITKPFAPTANSLHPFCSSARRRTEILLNHFC